MIGLETVERFIKFGFVSTHKKPISIGIVVPVLSILADLIGAGGSSGYGNRQIVGTIVGAIMAVTGLFLLLLKKIDYSTLPFSSF